MMVLIVVVSFPLQPSKKTTAPCVWDIHRERLAIAAHLKGSIRNKDHPPFDVSIPALTDCHAALLPLKRVGTFMQEEYDVLPAAIANCTCGEPQEVKERAMVVRIAKSENRFISLVTILLAEGRTCLERFLFF